jgi:5-enolpyruvylshikimate-3-phosphate synthase
MNIRILSQIISCALLLFAMTTATETRIKPETTLITTTSNSWFRDKYLQKTYEEYYHYTLTRYKLEDNDYDVCPDFHKSSLFFAITGQHMNRIKKTCSLLYVETTANMNSNDYTSPNTTIYHDIMQDIQITIIDVLEFLGVVACYTFEISMLFMSVVLASCSTLFLIILLFCQY